ncbi:hypothetical protein [Bradyrhizobium barranii]
MPRNSRARRTEDNAELVREMYTFVTRIWRYRGWGKRPHSRWQAEIKIIEPAESQIQRVVGLKNLVSAIQSILRGKD